MTRPLQKKKNKSSLPRATQKPKSKRLNIKSNPIVAANWDQKLTLSQNYRRLGLSSKLNAHTGGTEKKVEETISPSVPNPLTIPSSREPKALGTTDVNVMRDPKTGAIISVERSEARANPLGDLLNELDEDEEEAEENRNGNGNNSRSGGRTSIVQDLEESAKFGKNRRPRLQSQREREWVESLVEKWGDDWGGMVRDRKLNPHQQTEGDIKRRVGVWKARRRSDDDGGMEA